MTREDPDRPGVPLEETDGAGQPWVHVTTPDGAEGWMLSIHATPLANAGANPQNDEHDDHGCYHVLGNTTLSRLNGMRSVGILGDASRSER